MALLDQPKTNIHRIDCGAPFGFPVVIFGRRVRRLSRTSQDKVASVGAYVGEALQHIKIVQGMNHQQLDEKAFTEHVESAFGAGIQRIQQRAF